MSQRQNILAAITSRIETIHVADGFQTDAGAAVFSGEVPELGPNDVSVAVAIVPRDEVPLGNDLIEWPILVAGVAKADIAAPAETIEALNADIVKAIELPGDQTLAGLVKWMARGARQALPREAGSETIGAITPYTVRFVERWGG